MSLDFVMYVHGAVLY